MAATPTPQPKEVLTIDLVAGRTVPGINVMHPNACYLPARLQHLSALRGGLAALAEPAGALPQQYTEGEDGRANAAGQDRPLVPRADMH